MWTHHTWDYPDSDSEHVEVYSLGPGCDRADYILQCTTSTKDGSLIGGQIYWVDEKERLHQLYLYNAALSSNRPEILDVPDFMLLVLGYAHDLDEIRRIDPTFLEKLFGIDKAKRERDERLMNLIDKLVFA